MTAHTSPLTSLQNDIDGDLFWDEISTQLVATDASFFEIIPQAVAYPKNSLDVEKILRFAGKNSLAVHARGAGSGVCGSALGSGIVLDFTRHMNKMLSFDLENQTITCQPGYKMGQLNEFLADTSNTGGQKLFFPPDPSSGNFATFGGMYATNASGAHSAKYGNVADYVAAIKLTLASGSNYSSALCKNRKISELEPSLQELYNTAKDAEDLIATAYPPTNYNTSGYNLKKIVCGHHLSLTELIGGSEGTLGIVTELTLQLRPQPTHEEMVMVVMDDIQDSVSLVQKILPHKPMGIELLHKKILEKAVEYNPKLAAILPQSADNVLLVEFDGNSAEECAQSVRILQELTSDQQGVIQVTLANTAQERDDLRAVRKAAVPILYKPRGKKRIIALVEDAAVPIERMGEYFHGIDKIFADHKLEFVSFGHIAKGLMHTRPFVDMKSAEDVEKLTAIADDFFEMVMGLKGSVSGEHGDGRIRSPYIERAYPTLFPLFKKVKAILDPENILNPEIITHCNPKQLEEDLQYGPKYRARYPKTELKFDEGYDIAVEACHGCSTCTIVSDSLRMCPVYKSTGLEAATPKAKANVLRGLLRGSLVDAEKEGKAILGVMKLCAHCGSCVLDCPSNVNIPKMATEAKARYSKKYGYSPVERLLVNATTLADYLPVPLRSAFLLGKNRPIQKIAAATIGLNQRKSLPIPVVKPLAKRIPQMNRGKICRVGSGKKLLYFAGCYASQINPELGEKTVQLFTELGFDVLLPKQGCCGLPHITKGLVDDGKRRMQQNLSQWHEQIGDVDHIITSCSSCNHALLTEWKWFLDEESCNQIAEKLIHWSALLQQLGNELRYDAPWGKISYHMPCHMRHIPQPNSTIELLQSLSEEGRVKQSANSCCGLMGTFGLAKRNAKVNQHLGQRMSEIEKQGQDAIVTDCPTCRMQAEEFTSLPVRHPIENIVAKEEI